MAATSCINNEKRIDLLPNSSFVPLIVFSQMAEIEDCFEGGPSFRKENGMKKTRTEDRIKEKASTRNICREPQKTATTPASPGPSIPSNCQVAFDKAMAFPNFSLCRISCGMDALKAGVKKALNMLSRKIRM